jgi:hypothetical protein
MSSATSSSRLSEKMKIQRIGHCETLRVVVAFAVVEQAFAEF